jgi:DnaJ family protein C protein 19
MIRLLFFAIVISLACKMMFGKWPWDFLRPASTRAQAVFKARKLLAVNAEASRQDIVEAHKRLLTMVHPDRGGSNAQVHEANAARDLLLDELPYESVPPP